MQQTCEQQSCANYRQVILVANVQIRSIFVNQIRDLKQNLPVADEQNGKLNEQAITAEQNTVPPPPIQILVQLIAASELQKLEAA